jgi:L-alanine-DL-glutamate epimerase-like enolase superfamily enzyme
MKIEKIARVEAFRLYPMAIKEAWVEDEYVWPSHPPSVLVKVTAENGVYGVGEASSQQWYLGETVDQLLELARLFDATLKGTDPGNFALCHHKMEGAHSGGMPGARSMRSAVDMALYDLVGKARGLPVHALLGGAYRGELTMLTNLYHKTPEAMAEGCRDYVARGFKGLKIKVGDEVLAKGWTRDTMLAELAKLDAALEATPRDVYIDADANQGWESAAWTVTSLRRYAAFDNLSIEQPLPYADLEGHAHVRRAAGVPVILDESIWSAKQMLQVARLQACDRIVLKLNRLGGFHESMKAVAICESANIGVSVDTNPYTMIGDTACCHIAAAIRTHYPVDCEGHVSFLDWGPHKFVTGGIRIDGGIARLPDTPGLGVDVDWAALERHMKAGYAR